jgi:phosphoglycerol transferase
MTASWTMLRLGLSGSTAILGSFVYAWLPFHQITGFAHFTNGFYALVPLAIWILMRIWHEDLGGSAGRRFRVLAAGVLLLLTLQNSYYGFFFGVLAVSYGILFLLLRGLRSSRVGLITTAVLVGVVIVTFSCEQLPRWLFELREGKNFQAVVRPPSGPSEFALSLADLVNPSPDHAIDALSRFSRRAARELGHSANERIFVSLPVVALLGFVLAVASLVSRAYTLTERPASRLVERAGFLIAIAFLWAHEGGLCTLLGELGFGLVRGWNRIVVYSAFAALVAASSSRGT